MKKIKYNVVIPTQKKSRLAKDSLILSLKEKALKRLHLESILSEPLGDYPDEVI